MFSLCRPDIDAKADSHIQIYFGADDFLYLLIGIILLRKKAKKEELIQFRLERFLKGYGALEKDFGDFIFRASKRRWEKIKREGSFFWGRRKQLSLNSVCETG